MRGAVLAATAACAVLACAGSAAAAPWGPPAVLAEGRYNGLMATLGPGGVTELLATGTPSAVFVSAPGTAPVRGSLPPELPLGYHELARNAAGEAVIAGGGSVARVGIRGADGAFGPLQLMPGWEGEGIFAAAVGPDGTAVVAWSQSGRGNRGFVEVSVRPPGGAFGPPRRLASGTDGANVHVAVDAAGSTEVLFVHEAALVRFVRPAGGAFAASPERVMDRNGGGVEFDAAPDGRAVLVYQTRSRSTTTLWARRRPAGASRFGPPERLARVREKYVAPALAVTPDGAMVAYVVPPNQRSYMSVRARRVIGDHALGPEQTVSRREVVRGPRFSEARLQFSQVQIAANGRGDVALFWQAHCLGSCGDQVVAAVAPARAGFKPPEHLAEVGSQIRQLAFTLNERGDAQAAWTEVIPHSEDSGPGRKDRLVLAAAVALPAAAPSPGDRRPPRVRLAVRRSVLRAAARTGRLRMRIGCDEPCAVHLGSRRVPNLTFQSPDYFPPVALRAPGTRTLRFRLTRRGRRQLVRAVRHGPVTIRALARDRAGNLRVAETRG